VGVSVLAPLLLRHLASYAELGAAAAVECRGAWARRLGFLLLGMVFAMASVVALWATGLVALWNTPWRLVYAACSALLLLFVAILALRGATSSAATGPSSGALKGEVRKDLELFRQWKGTL
jgi:membrane protein implicated in regulation of membrane protease activity